LKYYHVKDAKMSLASHLLKHLVVTKYGGVPWSKSTISRDSNGKPYFIPASGSPTMDFNVSHQAGIISLIASIGFMEKADVGTDVVCANEREKHDYAHIEKSGFFDWVDMHGDVFAESELNHMKLSPVSLDIEALAGFAKDTVSRCQRRNETLTLKIKKGEGEEKTVRVDSNTVIDEKLRRFYAMWCLRETYVKMTGEALLAPWLKDLEISNVEAPPPAADHAGEDSLEQGGIARDFQIYFKGKAVTDVKMELVAMGKHYMVGSSVRMPKGETEWSIGRWQTLDLGADILPVAESNP
jgi:4'-phosphopantetheinyl transferase